MPLATNQVNLSCSFWIFQSKFLQKYSVLVEKAGRAARQSCVERTDKTVAVLPKDTCCGETTAGRAGDPAGTHKQSQLWSTSLQAET